jgi:hypothetical protein
LCFLFRDHELKPVQVNMKVGQTLAASIEKGEQTAQATKETIGALTWRGVTFLC